MSTQKRVYRTFDEWWMANGPFINHISRGLCEKAWNAGVASVRKPISEPNRLERAPTPCDPPDDLEGRN